MEVKNQLVFEIKKADERVYKFIIPVNAPLGESYESACQFKEKMITLINEHHQKELEASAPKDDTEDASQEEK